MVTAQQNQQKPLTTETFTFTSADGQPLTVYTSRPQNPSAIRGGILIAHDFNGRDQFENGKADAMAQLGFYAVAMDVYGRVGADAADNQRLMGALVLNRPLLHARLTANMAQLRQRMDSAVGRPNLHMSAFGFCFGGLAVIDMARTNMPLRSAISFHGILPPLNITTTAPIGTKLLILHGFDDQSVSMDNVIALGRELSARSADWQVKLYGSNTGHAFAVPGPRFHPVSDRHSWTDMMLFLNEDY